MTMRPHREPSSDNRQIAAALHEMFVAYVEAGFTEQQAMDIVLTLLRAQVPQPPS